MFENILGHDGIIALLKKEIEGDRLPHSLLFYGDAYGGKLTTAFELARVLTCRNSGQWSCGCFSCRSNRLLENGNMLFLSSRDFSGELEACSDTLVRSPVQAAQYLFYRSVRKVTRQFDEILWRGQEQSFKKIAPELERINDALEAVSPERGSITEKAVSVSVKKIKTSFGKMENILKTDGISVNRIRNMAFWTHTTAGTGSKVVIIDGADKLGEGARNALLKILEEPPSNVFFILVSKNREGIMPTVLSRVRPYFFPERSFEVQMQVISRIFRDTEIKYGGLREFFLSKNRIDRELLNKYAHEIIRASVEGKKMAVEEMENMLAYVSDRKIFVPFAEELAAVFKDIITGVSYREKMSVHEVSVWYNKLKELMRNRELYNQNISLLLSSFIYEMVSIRGIDGR